MAKVVIFDVFGTLVQIQNRRSPYLRLLKLARLQGRRPLPDDALQLMTLDMTLASAARHFGIKISDTQLQELEQRLAEELESMALFSDAPEAIELLQNSGVRVGVCSNLASSYGLDVKRLLPRLDAYTFSYEVGHVKPDPAIYRAACASLGIEAGHWFDSHGRVLMLGDSRQCDRDGPREVGVMGYLLGRAGKGDFRNLLEFAKAVVSDELSTG
ncbi:HAD family hydrolase [Stutzerimonas stutzeri]|uniref:HAD family hydrolase n=1 Tax=Stutzerimonas stutzeri TaxID=316 RepID=UPI0015E3ECE1|nr:HAD-IA family hydrolase [Stutzerimonas stutzeri]MBA1278809.1 HAD-IA family hydrolase [Stutzerimonas stutzeri]